MTVQERWHGTHGQHLGNDIAHGVGQPQAVTYSAPKAASQAQGSRAEGAEATHKGTQPATWMAIHHEERRMDRLKAKKEVTLTERENGKAYGIEDTGYSRWQSAR